MELDEDLEIAQIAGEHVENGPEPCSGAGSAAGRYLQGLSGLHGMQKAFLSLEIHIGHREGDLTADPGRSFPRFGLGR